MLFPVVACGGPVAREDAASAARGAPACQRRPRTGRRHPSARLSCYLYCIFIVSPVEEGEMSVGEHCAHATTCATVLQGLVGEARYVRHEVNSPRPTRPRRTTLSPRFRHVPLTLSQVVRAGQNRRARAPVARPGQSLRAYRGPMMFFCAAVGSVCLSSGGRGIRAWTLTGRVSSF